MAEAAALATVVARKGRVAVSMVLAGTAEAAAGCSHRQDHQAGMRALVALTGERVAVAEALMAAAARAKGRLQRMH